MPAPATDAANDAVRLNQQLRELAKRHDELQNELRVRESLKKRCFDEVETVERELELVRKHREESDQAKVGFCRCVLVSITSHIQICNYSGTAQHRKPSRYHKHEIQ